MTTKTCFLLPWLFLASGCLGGSTRTAYPQYYGGWEDVPAHFQAELDVARKRATDAERSGEHLLVYARLSGRLARGQAANWLALASEAPDNPAHNTRVARARRRLLDSCNHTLTLYEEIRFTAGRLHWKDRVEMAWLLFLTDSDAQAGELLVGTLGDPEVPTRARREIDFILEHLHRSRDTEGAP
jgi:hypothetical protein